MTSPVDVCNEALAEIGTRSSITSLTEISAEAFNCSLFYDRMRKMLLRTAHWGFARAQLQLSLLQSVPLSAPVVAGNMPPFPYLYEYAHPADCIRLRYLIAVPPGWPFPVNGVTNFVQTGDPVVAPMFAPSRGNRFLIANDVVSGTRQKVILSNLFTAIGVYTRDEDNPELWDDLFHSAMVATLASKIVIPLTGNAGMKVTFMEQAKALVDQARASDANEARPTTDHTPDWIKVRGFQYDWYVSGPAPFGWGSWFGDWDDLTWGM